MNDTELRKQMEAREAKTAAKVDKLLDKGRDLTASDIKWLRQKEVDRRRIAKAMKMSLATFERYLASHKLIGEDIAAPEKSKTKKKKIISSEMKAEIRRLLVNSDMPLREIATEMGVSYGTVDYQKRQMAKEREIMTNKLSEDYEDKIKQLEERNRLMKQESERYQKAVEKLKADRQNLYENLQEERSKVKEREKMLEQLNKHVQKLISEREDLMKNDMKENVKKQRDLLLEYIQLGGTS